MVEDEECDLCRQREQTMYHILSICRKIRAEKKSTIMTKNQVQIIHTPRADKAKPEEAPQLNR